MDALERDLRREFPLYPDLQGDLNAAQMIQLAKQQCNGIHQNPKELEQKPPHIQVGTMLQSDQALNLPQPTPGGFVDQVIRAFEADPLGLSPGGYYFNTNTASQNIKDSQEEKLDEWRNQNYNSNFPTMDWDSFAKNDLSSTESFYEDEAFQRTFNCPEPNCGASFKRKQHLIRHQQSHDGSRQYNCVFEGCNKSFTRQDNLTAHEKRCHPSYTKKEEHPLEKNLVLKASYDGSFVDRKDPYFQGNDPYYMNYIDQSLNRVDQSFYSL
jgi:hypothetical protein